jgi:hypothetical protein
MNETIITNRDLKALINAAKEYQVWNRIPLTRSPELRRDLLAAEKWLKSSLALEQEYGIRLAIFSDSMAELAEGATELNETQLALLCRADSMILPDEISVVWEGTLLSEALVALKTALNKTDAAEIRRIARLLAHEDSSKKIVAIRSLQ